MYGGAQPIVGGIILRLVFLGSIRKQAEQVMRSKPVSSTPPWLLHQLQLQVPVLLEFLSWIHEKIYSDVEV